MSRELRGADDRTLAVAAAGGDRSAAEILLRRHHDLVLAVCRRIVLDRGGAEDAAQNALVAVARALPRFDGRSEVRTWIYRIATNAALDEVRRTRRRPWPVEPGTVAEAPALRTPGAPDPGDMVADRDSLMRALEEVPEEFRAALALRFILDMDYAEIAATLGIPVGTVRSRLARGKALLAKGLGGNPDGVGDRQTRRADSGADGHEG